MFFRQFLSNQKTKEWEREVKLYVEWKASSICASYIAYILLLLRMHSHDLNN